jgi:hypothetical protein
MSTNDSIGRWYEEKRLEALEIQKSLEDARNRNAPYHEIQKLERKLERARYVGD